MEIGVKSPLCFKLIGVGVYDCFKLLSEPESLEMVCMWTCSMLTCSLLYHIRAFIATLPAIHCGSRVGTEANIVHINFQSLVISLKCFEYNYSNSTVFNIALHFIARINRSHSSINISWKGRIARDILMVSTIIDKSHKHSETFTIPHCLTTVLQMRHSRMKGIFCVYSCTRQ